MQDKPTDSQDKDKEQEPQKIDYKMRKRYRSRGLRNQDQAMADWFGISSADDERKPRNLDYILAEVLSKLPLDAAVEPESLREGWKRAAGDFIGNQAELVSIVKGVATVHVLQPAMRYHMMQWQGVLLDKLRSEFGNETIQSIRFRIG